jgi:hypothetical protein
MFFDREQLDLRVIKVTWAYLALLDPEDLTDHRELRDPKNLPETRELKVCLFRPQQKNV